RLELDGHPRLDQVPRQPPPGRGRACPAGGGGDLVDVLGPWAWARLGRGERERVRDLLVGGRQAVGRVGRLVVPQQQHPRVDSSTLGHGLRYGLVAVDACPPGGQRTVGQALVGQQGGVNRLPVAPAGRTDGRREVQREAQRV